MPEVPSPIERQIYSVTDLTVKIKALLEETFAFIWISGEISNFSKPASGHFYFTLKDSKAQIRAVMFRGQNRNLTFQPTDGVQVIGLGRISLYEPRGTYQIILEYLEPKGVGAAQIAFEALKRKLDEEGLFAPERKRPLPFLPQKIALITSSTGAVVHDMLRILLRRYPNLKVLILPVHVQGREAVADIVAAFDLLSTKAIVADVAILARGGGSMEDMAAFNSEAVARAIFGAEIPVVSAVGHETDFSIADFVADLRAPTPSAAAELVVPIKEELVYAQQRLIARLEAAIRRNLLQYRKVLAQQDRHLVDPRRKVQDLRLRLDDADMRLRRAMHQQLRLRRERYQWWQTRLIGNHPQKLVDKHNEKLLQSIHNLKNIFDIKLSLFRSNVLALRQRLNGLSPTAVLARGYSITRADDGKIIRDTRQVTLGQRLEVMLHKGALEVDVQQKRVQGFEGSNKVSYRRMPIKSLNSTKKD